MSAEQSAALVGQEINKAIQALSENGVFIDALARALSHHLPPPQFTPAKLALESIKPERDFLVRPLPLLDGKMIVVLSRHAIAVPESYVLFWQRREVKEQPTSATSRIVLPTEEGKFSAVNLPTEENPNATPAFVYDLIIYRDAIGNVTHNEVLNPSPMVLEEVQRQMQVLGFTGTGFLYLSQLGISPKPAQEG